MKDLIVSTLASEVDPYVGKVDGIRLEPVPDSPRIKLMGLVGPSRVTLCVYDDPNQALGAFLSCQRVILDPSINPVILQFKPVDDKPEKDLRASLNREAKEEPKNEL